METQEHAEPWCARPAVLKAKEGPSWKSIQQHSLWISRKNTYSEVCELSKVISQSPDYTDREEATLFLSETEEA